MFGKQIVVETWAWQREPGHHYPLRVLRKGGKCKAHTFRIFDFIFIGFTLVCKARHVNLYKGGLNLR